MRFYRSLTQLWSFSEYFHKHGRLINIYVQRVPRYPFNKARLGISYKDGNGRVSWMESLTLKLENAIIKKKEFCLKLNFKALPDDEPCGNNWRNKRG